jgi:hypothetical protein
VTELIRFTIHSDPEDPDGIPICRARAVEECMDHERFAMACATAMAGAFVTAHLTFESWSDSRVPMVESADAFWPAARAIIAAWAEDGDLRSRVIFTEP